LPAISSISPAKVRARTASIFPASSARTSASDFNDSPKVINGCSDLFVEVFGDAGRHARSAVGNVMLPNQISVEIEGIVAVKP
jgi:enamine deaminase RidA (YjgF/YER057c/UK114 family)